MEIYFYPGSPGRAGEIIFLICVCLMKNLGGGIAEHPTLEAVSKSQPLKHNVYQPHSLQGVVGEVACVMQSLPNQAALWIVTAGALGPVADSTQWVHAGVVSLTRSYLLEVDTAQVYYLDLVSHCFESKQLIEQTSAEVVMHGEFKLVPKLGALPKASLVVLPKVVFMKLPGTFVISGGSGALGRFFANCLTEWGVESVALLSRSGKQTSDGLLKNLSLQHTACDVGSHTCVVKVIEALHMKTLPVQGVIHAAGVNQHAQISELRRKDVQTMFAPKLHGASNLHSELSSRNLDTFVALSSVSAVFGVKGGSVYVGVFILLTVLTALE